MDPDRLSHYGRGCCSVALVAALWPEIWHHRDPALSPGARPPQSRTPPAGETLVATATRTREGHTESGRLELKVAGVLSLRASELKAVYVPLEILEAVEQFKDGQAVPEYGWQGSTPKAYPQYDGMIVVLP